MAVLGLVTVLFNSDEVLEDFFVERAEMGDESDERECAEEVAEVLLGDERGTPDEAEGKDLANGVGGGLCLELAGEAKREPGEEEGFEDEEWFGEGHALVEVEQRGEDEEEASE